MNDVVSTTRFSDRCENPGFYDRWTCPACYVDLEGARPGEAICPACGEKLQLSVDYEPVCVAQVVVPREAR